MLIPNRSAAGRSAAVIDIAAIRAMQGGLSLAEDLVRADSVAGDRCPEVHVPGRAMSSPGHSR